MKELGKFADYQALAKLEYGRMLWKSAKGRKKLLDNWTHPDHPHRERFANRKHLIKEILETDLNYQELDLTLKKKDSSLRAAMREIPSYFPNLTN